MGADLVLPHLTRGATPFDDPGMGDRRLRVARHVDDAAALERERV